MNRTLAIITAALMILSGLAIASGAPGGGSTAVGTSETGTGTASGTADLTGGNVTAVNVSGNQITGRWGGFYGNVSGGIQLADSGSNLFYEWTVSDYTNAYVFAANGTVTNWSLQAAAATDQPAYLQQSAADNWTNTFTASEAFQTASIGPVAATPYTDTYDDGQAATFRTYSLYSSDDTAYVYAARAIDNATGFNTDTVDYQLLAPADSGVVSYQFYLELP